MQQLPLRDLYGCSWTKSRQQPVKTMAGVKVDTFDTINCWLDLVASHHEKRMSTGGCGCLAFTSPNMGPTVR